VEEIIVIVAVIMEDPVLNQMFLTLIRGMDILRLVHVDVMGPLLWLIIKRLINMQAYEE